MSDDKRDGMSRHTTVYFTTKLNNDNDTYKYCLNLKNDGVFWPVMKEIEIEWRGWRVVGKKLKRKKNKKKKLKKKGIMTKN